jgi:hypothetical protein
MGHLRALRLGGADSRHGEIAGRQLARDHVQGAALALRAGSIERGLLRFGQQCTDVGGGVEMDPTQGEGLAAVAVGEQSEVADLDEACRQDVEQEAADELDRVEGHDAAAVVVSGVCPAPSHSDPDGCLIRSLAGPAIVRVTRDEIAIFFAVLDRWVSGQLSAA